MNLRGLLWIRGVVWWPNQVFLFRSCRTMISSKSCFYFYLFWYLCCRYCSLKQLLLLDPILVSARWPTQARVTPLVHPWVVRTRSAIASCCSLGLFFIYVLSKWVLCCCVASLVISISAECAANLNLYPQHTLNIIRMSHKLCSELTFGC